MHTQDLIGDPLIERVRRVYHVLGQTRSDDISTIRGSHVVAHDRPLFRVDFNQGRTQADLQTVAHSLIASIASIKDHLRNWCKENGRDFPGEEILNSNRDAAIIHDLWNLDKHGKLSRPSRSGCSPRLVKLAQGLETFGISESTPADSSVSITFDMTTGELTRVTSDGGAAALVVNATVVDADGNELGHLQTICHRALRAWEQSLSALGISLPRRSADELSN